MNSRFAVRNLPAGTAVGQRYDFPLMYAFETLRQSKEQNRETMTSPTSSAVPMPPPVPVVITSFGWQSPMICFHTVAFGIGICEPSRDICESLLNNTTFFVPISAVQ